MFERLMMWELAQLKMALIGFIDYLNGRKPFDDPDFKEAGDLEEANRLLNLVCAEMKKGCDTNYVYQEGDEK